MLGTELGLLLLQIAAAGVNLLQKRGSEVGVVCLQAWIGGDDRLRITLQKRRDTPLRRECGLLSRQRAGG